MTDKHAKSQAKPSEHAMKQMLRDDIPAERAATPAQTIDSVDPYDPTAFNNQADAPTQLPTPAERVLHGRP